MNMITIRVIRPDGATVQQVIVPEGYTWEPEFPDYPSERLTGPFMVQRRREPDGEWETLGEATDGWQTYCSRKVRLP